MKYKLILLIMICLTSVAVYAQTSIYDQAVNDIESNSISLSGYSGKKLLFIVLPLTSSDTTVRQQLLRFQQRYDSSRVRIIGLVAMEEGYSSENKAAVEELYADNIQAGLLLTTGIAVRKSSGSSQAPLLQWLTNKDNNLHYDQDADEVGKKFFVSETGRLYAVLGASTPLDGRIIDRICNADVPADQPSNPQN